MSTSNNRRAFEEWEAEMERFLADDGKRAIDQAFWGEDSPSGRFRFRAEGLYDDQGRAVVFDATEDDGAHALLPPAHAEYLRELAAQGFTVSTVVSPGGLGKACLDGQFDLEAFVQSRRLEVPLTVRSLIADGLVDVEAYDGALKLKAKLKPEDPRYALVTGPFEAALDSLLSSLRLFVEDAHLHFRGLHYKHGGLLN